MPAEDPDDDRSRRSADRTTVLVADGDEFRETLTLWLSDDERREVREAADGEAARAKLDGTVDVLVLDRRMPMLSGPEVVDRLDERDFDGSIVVLSAVEPDSHLNDTATYLTKPIERETFVDAISRSQ